MRITPWIGLTLAIAVASGCSGADGTPGGAAPDANPGDAPGIAPPGGPGGPGAAPDTGDAGRGQPAAGGEHNPPPTDDPPPAKPTGSDTSLTLSSLSFSSGEAIPAKYTCDGDDLSPSLQWANPPDGTRSFALVCDDPDAPGGTWIHWLLFDLPVDTTELAEGAGNDAGAGTAGTNSWKKTGWGGPCPPPGAPHHYRFRLYALDTQLKLGASTTRAQFDQAISGHVLAEATLMGTYERAAD